MQIVTSSGKKLLDSPYCLWRLYQRRFYFIWGLTVYFHPSLITANRM
jgi:hypothetical protein